MTGPCMSATRAVEKKIQSVFETIRARDPEQKEFLQAVQEVLDSLEPVFIRNPQYLDIFRVLAEPERMLTFRVSWKDDKGNIHVNRGYRVQFSSALGPYKGGLRFHPTVNLSVVKFLGFEQILKNSLTGLPMGGAKGGSDFDPHGKSDSEVLRFCDSFMDELHRHIGPNTDVPAGDIGVGGREIGYLFGRYKKLKNSFDGVLTGKDPKWGGSLIRPEATGYGLVYYAQFFLESLGESFKGKRCVVSGSGNVSQYTIEKLLELEAVPLTASDSDGYVLEPNGFDTAKLRMLMKIKNEDRGRVADYVKVSPTAKYFHKATPWDVPCDVAFPCATQNEIDVPIAKLLLLGGCKLVAEGANMPTTNDAIHTFRAGGVVLLPAKAANAGGVAVSGLEMSQNSQRLKWSRDEVDNHLRGIMREIFLQSSRAAEEYGKKGDMVAGANIAGFLKVADSLIEQGCQL